MAQFKEHLLNGLLAVLVGLSILLSSLVWFPSERNENPSAKEAQVQAPPPVVDRRMPDVFRPERIVVQRSDGRTAVFLAGSSHYLKIWQHSGSVLADIRPDFVPVLPEDAGPSPAETDLITIVFPAMLRFGDWAERWGWTPVGLPSPFTRIDQVTLSVGAAPGIQLSGPGGGVYRFGPFHEADQRSLARITAEIDAGLFRTYRALEIGEFPLRTIPSLLVPELITMPFARLVARMPEETAEVARFFPDLSVVRQIEERDAKSYTDGQRLLRLTASGILEFRTADSSGAAPDLQRSLMLAQDWMASRGGWPQDVVLERYLYEPGRIRLQFEIRAGGPFPVESVGSALMVGMSSDRISQLRRYPEFTEMVFDQEHRLIISPEEAIKAMLDASLPRLSEEIREVYAGYLVRPAQGPAKDGWVLEPVWVIRIGDSRIYVPADAGLKQRVPVLQQ